MVTEIIQKLLWKSEVAIFLKFFFKCIYLFLRERERETETETERMSRGGAEREGDRRSEAGSLLTADRLMRGSSAPAVRS